MNFPCLLILFYAHVVNPKRNPESRPRRNPRRTRWAEIKVWQRRIDCSLQPTVGYAKADPARPKLTVTAMSFFLPSSIELLRTRDAYHVVSVLPAGENEQDPQKSVRIAKSGARTHLNFGIFKIHPDYVMYPRKKIESKTDMQDQNISTSSL